MTDFSDGNYQNPTSTVAVAPRPLRRVGEEFGVTLDNTESYTIGALDEGLYVVSQEGTANYAVVAVSGAARPVEVGQAGVAFSYTMAGASACQFYYSGGDYIIKNTSAGADTNLRIHRLV